jgi:hypothetical protein
MAYMRKVLGSNLNLKECHEEFSCLSSVRPGVCLHSGLNSFYFIIHYFPVIRTYVDLIADKVFKLVKIKKRTVENVVLLHYLTGCSLK